MNIGAYMSAKSLKLLRIGVLVLGWILIVAVLGSVWSQFGLYYRAQNNPAGFFGSMVAQFDFANSLGSFFSGFGNAFFAFLIAAVFRMIEKQAPVGIGNARRLMIVCCLSYLACALTRFCSFLPGLAAAQSSHLVRNFGLSYWFSFSSTLIPVIVPILYAASIFVLYMHFTKLVTFESEVA
jgi:hypothetical protein